MQTYTLKNKLRDAIKEYRRERPKVSLRAIAKNSGVNRYFLTKLMDEEDLSDNIDMQQVLALSRFIIQKDSVSEVLHNSSLEVQEALHQIFNVDFTKNKKIFNLYESLNLYDRYTYFVLVLASFHSGSHESLFAKILGDAGAQQMQKLLKDGYLRRSDEGNIELKMGNEFTNSLDVLKQHIPDYLDFYSYARNGLQKNHIHVYAEALNRESILKIHALHAKLNRDLQAILEDPKNMGEIPFFSFACMDYMLDMN